jgi:hypothetical protein
MSDILTLIRKFTAFGQDLTATSSLANGSPAEVAQAYAFATTHTLAKAVDGAASTTTAATYIWHNPTPYPMRLIGASIVSPAGTLTASDTVYATINILTDDGAAGTPTAAFTRTTKLSASGGSGNWAAAVMVNLANETVASAQQVIAPGASVWYSIAKASTGTVVPASIISITVTKA